MVPSGSVDGEPGAGPPSDVPLVPCVGAVVHDGTGRLLLIRRGHDPHRGCWSLPGGRVEAGESVEQAVEREVLEETGLTVRAGAPVGRILIPAGAVTYDVLDLRCELAEPGGQPVAGDDADDARFVDPAALAQLTCTPRLVETLQEWGVLPT
jgi:8-oxo-dGTP diphosphatase